ncbi:MAG TPA: glycosyltransferase family 39 protein [Candidatus Polarisedimenticolia bacterium]|nr:glycosyltransferase family 39 protein [Candidatus Polarisedimenticolia bacterium]
MTRRLRDALILGAVGGVLLFAGLGRADLFNPDEPRESEMAREMLVTGDHVVPRLDGEPFLEKPPLFYWLVTGAYRAAGGPSEAAARVVPAIAGFLCLFVTCAMARRLFGDGTALPAALVLLTGFESFWLARRTLIDMPMTLAILVACDALHRVVTAERRAPRGWLAAATAALAGALLFKGVIGAAIPGLAVAGWLLWRLDLRPIRRRGLLLAGVLSIVPVGLWVRALHARLGDAAVHEFVVVNNVQRFTGGAAKGHDNPFWYYLPAIVVDFFPWSILLPFAIGAAARVALRAAPWTPAAGEAEERERAGLRDLLVWFLLPLLVLSIASTKRGLYLLPIYPAAAMLVAWWLTRGRPGRVGRWAGVAAAVLPGMAATAALAGTGHGGPAAAMTIATAGVAALAVRFVRRDEPSRLGFAIASVAAAWCLLAATVVAPSVVNGGTSARAAGESLRRRADAGKGLAFYDFREGNLGGFCFYARGTWPNLKSPEALARHLDGEGDSAAKQETVAGEQGHGGSLALLKGEDVARVAASLPFPIEEVERWRYRSRPGQETTSDYVLIRRAAAPEGAPGDTSAPAGDPAAAPAAGG